MSPLVEECATPITVPELGGADLAARSIASDGAALKRHQIVQAFQDSRLVDWAAVHEDGLLLLRETSKDLYALWGVLAPLPVVRGMGFAGVADGFEVCNVFLGDLWDCSFPRLPEGLNARASVFGDLVRRWTGFAERATPEDKDFEALTRIVAALEPFTALCEQRFAPERRPTLGTLRQLVTNMHKGLTPAPAVEEGSAAAAGGPAGEAVTVVAVGNVGAGDLDRSFQSAMQLITRQPKQALAEFAAVVERQSRRADQFRGRVYLAELFLRAGHEPQARQMLTFLDEECGKIRLEDWEPELCGRLWSTLYQAMCAERNKSNGSPPSGVEEKMRDLFARVCRIDPNQAITLKPQ